MSPIHLIHLIATIIGLIIGIVFGIMSFNYAPDHKIGYFIGNVVSFVLATNFWALTLSLPLLI